VGRDHLTTVHEAVEQGNGGFEACFTIKKDLAGFGKTRVSIVQETPDV